MKTKNHGNGIIEFISPRVIVNTPNDWTDLFISAGQKAAIIRKENIHKDFYDLTTGFAGEFLQKFSTYSKRLAIVGDFSESQVKSKALRDFIRESNRTKQIVFAPTAAEALKLFEN